MVNDLLTTDLRRVTNNTTAAEAFQVYTAKGYIAVPLNGKDPSVNGTNWQLKKYSAEDFNGKNVGLILGVFSGNLVDIDLDCPEARALAPLFLPETGMRHGRPSASNSHYWFITDVPIKARQYKNVTVEDSDGKKNRQMLVELRSSVGVQAFQTMVPPSVHPNGETLLWENCDEPAAVKADVLTKCVRRLAAATLLARQFPAVGGRHDFALALSGLLLRRGWDVDTAENFVFGVCSVGGSDNPKKHMACVKSTAARLAAGMTTVGLPALKDFIGDSAVTKIVEWLDFDRPALRLVSPTSDGEDGLPKDPRPLIRINTDEHLVIDKMIVALEKHPTIYRHTYFLAEVMLSEENAAPSLVVRPPGSPYIRQIPRPRLQSILCSAARFEKYSEKQGWLPTHPPTWLVAGVEEQGNWPGLNQLTSIGDSPIFLADGSVPTAPGYHEASGLFITNNTDLIIPEKPTQADAFKAVQRLLVLVEEFPFVTEAHRAAWVCALLTVLARFAFRGCVPLFFVEASIAAAGKSLLVDLLSVICFNRTASRSSFSPNDEEMRKNITTIVRAGDRLVLFDNIENGSLFKSSALDRVLTGEVWKDRLLGANDDVTAPVYTTWFASGNNLTIGGDLTRRMVHIRLEPQVERPELAKDFRIGDLLAYARKHRNEILSDAFTVLRAYHNAGRPDMDLDGWGSFEGWSNLPRSATVFGGLDDPGNVREGLVAMADQGRHAGAELIEALSTLLASRKVKKLSAKEILQATTDPKQVRLKDALDELCNMKAGQSLSPRMVTWALRKQRGCVFEGRVIRAVDGHDNLSWVVDSVDGSIREE